MRRDIWDGDEQEGLGAIWWTAVAFCAVVVGFAVAQLDVWSGVIAGALVFLVALGRMVCRDDPGQE